MLFLLILIEENNYFLLSLKEETAYFTGNIVQVVTKGDNSLA